MNLDPVTLDGRHVRLVPMGREHVPALWRAGGDPELWRLTMAQVASEDDMRRYVRAALAAQAKGTSLPFVTTDAATGQVIGSTRFGNVEAAHRRVEIGWTWIARPWQRTAVNTESKYLMLRHAFESLGCVRVELKTDVLNTRSRAAILRIGAREEGVLRKHQITEGGRVRDTVYFSVTDDEWPAVRARLEGMLAAPRARPVPYPPNPMTMPIRPSLALLLAFAAAGCTPARPSASPTPAPMPAAGPAAIAAGLDSIFDDTAFASAHWGVLVRSLETGETLYARNAGKMFVPASNMKIVTAAAALEALGPDYRYVTRIAAAGPVRDGVLHGDLVVIGGGDPTISDRFHGEVRTVFRAWADSLRARGVRRVTGAVIGNDDVFDDVPLGRGWAWDDAQDSYSAEVGGLQLNEGFVTVRVAPGPQRAAAVTTSPASDEWVPVLGTVWMAPAGTAPRVTVRRADSLSAVTVSGTLPPDTIVEEEISVRNNTRFFASVLRQALLEAGIGVGGQSLDADQDTTRGRPESSTVLFTHTSPPMRDILAAFMKPSQNQIGEILLKTLGRELRGLGTAGAGITAIDSMMASWGLPRRLLAQADGSGLSRYNLVAPEFLAALLQRETASPHFRVFYDAMPVAGRDGTLANRMRGTPAEGNVHAKTGTLSGVRSLSGYVSTAAGERMVFSMMVNHHTLSARHADRLAEAALMRLIALDRARAGN